eukprot:363781-Chlamydomonas_euryale.AAC.17
MAAQRMSGTEARLPHAPLSPGKTLHPTPYTLNPPYLPIPPDISPHLCCTHILVLARLGQLHHGAAARRGSPWRLHIAAALRNRRIQRRAEAPARARQREPPGRRHCRIRAAGGQPRALVALSGLEALAPEALALLLRKGRVPRVAHVALQHHALRRRMQPAWHTAEGEAWLWVCGAALVLAC